MTLLLGGLIAVAPLAMDIYLASLPSMAKALHASNEEVQLTLSLYNGLLLLLLHPPLLLPHLLLGVLDALLHISVDLLLLLRLSTPRN